MRLLPVAFALALGAMTPAVAATTNSASPSNSATSSSGSQAATGTSTKPQEFKTEAEAKSSCGSQQVVWANTSSHVLHAAGSQYYGKTKRGAYMCESSAERAGFHMAKNG